MAVRPPPRLRQRGAVLLVFLVLLVLGSLSLLTESLDRIGIEARRAQATWATLNQARDALLGYAATYRDTHSGNPVFGYLPCPDIDGDGSADALDSDCGGTDDKVVIGLLPYRQLGLDDHRDGTGACLWYAVSGTFKASTNKPAPMNWDTQGRISILDAGGNAAAAPEDGQGGAAAAVIAAGLPLSGQNRSGDPCGIANAKTVYAAYLDGGYAFPADAGATVQLRQGRTGSVSNNDQIAWITPREIFKRVKRRPDFAAHLNALIGELEGSLNAGHPAPQNAESKGDKKVGEVPAATSVAATWQNYRDNWRDQFRYAVCDDTGTPCLSVNGSGCIGVLIFAGERTSGGPRTAAEKASLASYLDAGNLAAYGSDSPPPGAFGGGTSVAIPDAGAPVSADTVRCLH